MKKFNDIKEDIGEVKHAIGWFFGFCSIGLHMTITFYFVLVGYAFWLNDSRHGPPLMEFVVLWHIVAIPAWVVKRVTLIVAETNFGKLLLMMSVPISIYFFNSHIGKALRNLGAWIENAF